MEVWVLSEVFLGDSTIIDIYLDEEVANRECKRLKFNYLLDMRDIVDYRSARERFIVKPYTVKQ